MSSAVYVILEDDFVQADPLVIKDAGAPWTERLTITNDVEGVVERLVEAGHLPEGRRLFYFDSEGDRDEILIEKGRFAGFAPAREGAS